MAMEFEGVDEPLKMRRVRRIRSSYPDDAVIYGNRFSRHDGAFENHSVNRTAAHFKFGGTPHGDEGGISNDYWIPGPGRAAHGGEISQKIDIEIVDPLNVDSFEKIIVPKFVSVSHGTADDIYKKFFELSQSIESLNVVNPNQSEGLRSRITISAGTLGILMSFVLVSLSLCCQLHRGFCSFILWFR